MKYHWLPGPFHGKSGSSGCLDYHTHCLDYRHRQGAFALTTACTPLYCARTKVYNRNFTCPDLASRRTSYRHGTVYPTIAQLLKKTCPLILRRFLAYLYIFPSETRGVNGSADNGYALRGRAREQSWRWGWGC